jgi:short-subunit dehydrogenase
MTKYALESLSDALRIEVRRFGVDVSLIEPEGVRTAFMDNLVWADGDGPYTELMTKLRALSERPSVKGLATSAGRRTWRRSS